MLSGKCPEMKINRNGQIKPKRIDSLELMLKFRFVHGFASKKKMFPCTSISDPIWLPIETTMTPNEKKDWRKKEKGKRLMLLSVNIGRTSEKLARCNVLSFCFAYSSAYIRHIVILTGWEIDIILHYRISFWFIALLSNMANGIFTIDLLYNVRNVVFFLPFSLSPQLIA